VKRLKGVVVTRETEGEGDRGADGDRERVRDAELLEEGGDEPVRAGRFVQPRL
jgi:hypothetical protein